MTQSELDKIIDRHQHWLEEDCEGWENMRANLCKSNLSGADLSGAGLSEADLCGADLRGANLRGANLCKSNLCGADLRGANLSEADLYWANLYVADLKSANLCSANLRSANLSGADLSGAGLSEADLCGADLRGANLSEADKFRIGQILTEPITGYKKTKEGFVITAEIPAGAIVFSINCRKCRTNRAKITDMGGHEILHSQYDSNFEYRLGREIEIKDFNLMYNEECASGFHFFRTRKEAEEY